MLAKTHTHMMIEVKNLHAIQVASIQHKGDYMQIGDKFDEIMLWGSEQDILDEDTRVLGIYYDNPMVVETDKLRSAACISIDEEAIITDEIEAITIAGGKYAVIMHLGAYEDIAETYLKVYNDDWFAETGNKPDFERPCYEEYLNEPEENDHSKLETLIYIPLI